MPTPPIRPDWADIQKQFRDYIAAYNPEKPDDRPAGRDRLFGAIYQAVEYLAIVHYRTAAGYNTGQTDLTLDGVRNRVWKVSYIKNNTRKPEIGQPDDEQVEAPVKEQQSGNPQPKKRRTFTSLVTQEYREEATLHTWLSRVVKNALWDCFRQQNRIHGKTLEMDQSLYEKIIEIGLSDDLAESIDLDLGAGSRPRSPEDLTELNQSKAMVAKMMADAPPRDQKILDQLYFQDLSYAEISESTGVADSTLRTRAERALARMRDTMPQQ